MIILLEITFSIKTLKKKSPYLVKFEKRFKKSEKLFLVS